MNTKMIVIAGAMTLAAFSAAQDAPFGPAQGVKTLSVSGSYSDTKDVAKQTSLQFVGSYFFTNAIEGRVGLAYNKVEAGGTSSTSDGILLGGRFYFNANQELTMETPLQPFAGLFFTSSKYSGSDRANGFGVEVGAHYFLQPNVALTPTLSFSRSRVNGDDMDTTALGFGLTVFFK